MKPPPPTTRLSTAPPPPRGIRRSVYRPQRPHGPSVLHLAREKNSSILAGWIMLAVATVLAWIPILGFVAWLIGGPLCLAGFILGILGASRGRALAGTCLIVASITIVPVIIFFAPMISIWLAAMLAAS